MNISDCNSLPPEVKKIFRKYRILTTETDSGKKNEEYTQANLRKSRDSEGKSLGSGPLISMDALARILAADLSPGYKWLDWMLFQCGGGVEAERRSAQALEQVKDRFIEERVRGYRDMRGQFHQPIDKEAAQVKWAAADNKFKDVLTVGDQDMAEKLQVFGFHRNWPGFNKVYENTSQTVAKFLSFGAKITEMNECMRQQNVPDKVIKTRPEDYNSTDSLGQAVAKIDRFYASLAARNDIRIDTIYEDDAVSVVCPLTYSAAVRYGWDRWNFANRAAFEQNLEVTNAWNDAWKNVTGKDSKLIVYIKLHVPVPSWIACLNNKFSRCSLQNLAILIPKANLRAFHPATAHILDEEGRAVKMDAIEKVIADEVFRDDSVDDEFPVKIGPRVYQTEKEASELFNYLDRALSEITEWAKTFESKRVVSDYLTGSDS